MQECIAVKSGYYFAIVPKAYLYDVELEETGIKLKVEGDSKVYTLYHGKTWADAQKIDKVLDDDGNQFAIREIRTHEVK